MYIYWLFIWCFSQINLCLFLMCFSLCFFFLFFSPHFYRTKTVWTLWGNTNQKYSAKLSLFTWTLFTSPNYIHLNIRKTKTKKTQNPKFVSENSNSNLKLKKELKTMQKQVIIILFMVVTPQLIKWQFRSVCRSLVYCFLFCFFFFHLLLQSRFCPLSRNIILDFVVCSPWNNHPFVATPNYRFFFY